MNTAALLLLGASGHCHALLSVIRRQAVYEPVGLLDSIQPIGSRIHGLPVLGREADAAALCGEHQIRDLFVALGDNFQRQQVSERLQRAVPDCRFAVLIDPSAVVAADACLAPGVAVMAQAHVGSGTLVGEGALINTSASIDHDGRLGAFASLAPGAITGGHVTIGSRTAIGLGARLIHRVCIGEDSVVGAGSLVLRDLPGGVVAYGSPALIARERAMDDPYL